jgi:hypothetical protein
VVLNQARIVLTPLSWMSSWIPTEISLLLILQVGIVLVALILALFSLGHVRFEGTSIWTRIGKRLTPVLLVGYAVSVITLLAY